MPAVCLYFQVHQPWRLRRYTYFDVGRVHRYDDEEKNRLILDRVAEKCYLPANRRLRTSIEEHGGEFRLAFSMTGVLLDQLAAYRPDVLESFQALAETGCVEFLGETYYHSLAYLYSPGEFRVQVARHADRVAALFGRRPTTFRHTELAYRSDLAHEVEEMGFMAILAEGTERILGAGSPHNVYRPAGCARLRLLLRDYRLSDDIAFRFTAHEGMDPSLTAATYARRVHQAGGPNEVINLFMDYETLGEHQWPETGIFSFLERLPSEMLQYGDLVFMTPSEAAANLKPEGELDVPEMVSWADTERDLSAWLGNAMQRDAVSSLYALEAAVCRRDDAELLETWRKLQTSDHFYYMCTKWFADGDVHKYFNAYESPYDAYINYMNILADFSRQVAREGEA